MEKKTFFARSALIILIVVFFLVPFALRGARMTLMGMKNDVKDWLPKDFQETKDLDEFRRYFLSEQFVLVSWDGCYGDESDERFKLFTSRLIPETPPSARQPKAEAPAGEVATEGAAAEPVEPSADEGEADEGPTNPTRYVHHDTDFVGDHYGLYYAGGWHEDWGHRDEKWLRGLRLEHPHSNEESWYYITPDGDLFRWDGVDSPFASLWREFNDWLSPQPVEGTLVHSFGPVDGRWYHDEPRRLRAQLFKTVTTGPDVLRSLTREGGELESDPEEAMDRLKGNLIGPDGKTTCLMLTLTEPARRNLHLVLGRGVLGKPRGQLYEIAEACNIPDEELRMGGPPVDNVAIDEEGSITLVRLVSFCAVLGIGLSLLCFRSITATIIIFFVGGISAVMSLAFVWWFGSSADAILMSMPALVYVLGLSGAAHIINYYREAVDEHGPVGAPGRAIAQGWKPAVLCNITTAIGLITLVSSELVPIQKFGLFSAIGVLATLLILFTYLPAALQIWPQKARTKRVVREGDDPWLEQRLAGVWHGMGSWIIKHNAVVAIGCTLIIIAFGYGLTRMKTSVNMLKMFHHEAKIIQDYEWLEANLGRLVPMEIVLRVPKQDQCPSNEQLRALQEELELADTSEERKAEIKHILHEAQFQLSFLERMELAARVQSIVEQEFGPEARNKVGRAISSATFVRPLPKAGGSLQSRLMRNSTSGRLEAHREEFLHSDYLRITKEDATELWRVSLRLGATQQDGEETVDYGEFITTLQQTVEPVVAAQHTRETVLREIDKLRRQAGQADEPLSGSKVLLVGAPTARPDKANANPVAATAGSDIDQHRIFVSSLRDLMTNSRLAIDVLPAEGPLPADLDQQLAEHDCVVILGDVPGLDPARLRKQSKLVVDARDHTFTPNTDQKTAFHQNPNTVSAVYTGVVPIVYKAQRLLLESLIQSTFWSVITITPLLMFIARSFSAGAVSMLPNVLPILMVFGGMGWLGIEVDVGSMMTASIALGVAVDDTIHYLNWFRAELDRLGDRKKAILAAYRHCATPTIQAAVISGLGLSVFAVSTFTPTQRFGVLMLVILWLGAIAELIYFPALLAGPLGSVFKPRKQKGQAGEQTPDASVDAATAVGTPQLLVVHHDSSDEDLSEVATNGATPITRPAVIAADDDDEPTGPPPPHAAGSKSGIFRSLRHDSPHRRK